jgi:4a-hydroxytetrahydrobiopterin dehydratase
MSQQGTPALRDRDCRPGAPALERGPVTQMLEQLPGWRDEGGQIARRFEFADFHHTMAFVNAVAWVAHQQDHHPDMEVGYKACTVRFSTHSAGGLTENDFICAARVDGLLEG